MKPFEKLVKSKTYHLTKLQNKLYGEVDKYLEENGLSKKDFAGKLKVSKGYVSQILNGGFDHKLSKMFELSLAIDKIPNIEFIDIEEYKKMELSKRMENIPLDLNDSEGNHYEGKFCLSDFELKKVHSEKPLMELSF